MPKRKVLKSVARSLADSFTSLMNFRGDDYIMGHILTAARDPGKSVLDVDLLTGVASPTELLTPPIRDSVASYAREFRGLVQRSGSDPTFVSSALSRVEYDINYSRRRR